MTFFLVDQCMNLDLRMMYRETPHHTTSYGLVENDFDLVHGLLEVKDENANTFGFDTIE